ncbi:MAG: RNA polymerase sigma factor [Eubacteriales bacterium]|nr:RNA polymerase sigma factor [Eubacteriales bacterium]
MDIQKLYEQYFSTVYKYLLSLSQNQHIAEEITQETFFKALQKIDSFDGSCHIRTWLCQIGKNTYFDYLRKHKKFFDLEEEPELLSDQNVELDYERAENTRFLHRVLHNLPEPYKEVFMLRTFGDLPFREISDLFGKSESWSKMTYLRAKKKIQEAIEHEKYQL